MQNRNPIWAFILSLIIPGLGQVYNGELKKGMLFLIAIFPIYLLVGSTGIIAKFSGMILLISLILLYKLLVSFEAFRTAKRLNPYQLKAINRTWKYALFGIIGYVIIWGATLMNRQVNGYEAFKIPTTAMEPNINVADRIIATSIKQDQIQLGDIITFEKEDGRKYLSRVMGLPNQQITIQHDRVIYADHSEQWIAVDTVREDLLEYQEFESTLPNGKKFKTKKILTHWGKEFPELETSNVEVQTIPSNKVFLMGDNRNDAMDSRMFGAINISQIDKKVNYIWWGKSIQRIGIRLDE